MKGTLVATLVIVTFALGITAPVLSVTVPRMAPVAPACPKAAFVANSRKNSPKLIRSGRITGLLSEGLQQIHRGTNNWERGYSFARFFNSAEHYSQGFTNVKRNF